MFISTKIVPINDVKEFQKVLNKVKKLCVHVFFREREPGEELKQDCFIKQTNSIVEVVFKPGLRMVKYRFDMDGKYLTKRQPMDCVRAMSKAFKIQRVKDIMGIDPDEIESAEPFLYKNPKYDGIAVKAYEYDLTGAYSQMLVLPLPDITTAKYDTKINEGQVGFYADGEHLRCSFKVGKVCQYVFDLMESPYKNWVARITKQLKEAKTKEERAEVKAKYQQAVGYLQKINPFWRCIIIERCNQEVKKYVDDNTIYCNTDSLISETRRYDLEADTEFDWKFKRAGQIFKWQKGKENYQWNDEIPAYRGPKKRAIEWYNRTHEKNWDILENDVPMATEHKYVLDRSKLKIYENKKY